MRLHELAPNEGATHRKRRVGRGPGSGKGKTSGRGHKGAKARDTVAPGKGAGPQTLVRQLPQLRGTGRDYGPKNFKKHYALVNLDDLEVFDDGAEVTPEALRERGIVGDFKDGVKILGDGELTKKLTVRAHKFSKSAAEKLAALGGAAEAL